MGGGGGGGGGAFGARPPPPYINSELRGPHFIIIAARFHALPIAGADPGILKGGGGGGGTNNKKL